MWVCYPILIETGFRLVCTILDPIYIQLTSFFIFPLIPTVSRASDTELGCSAGCVEAHIYLYNPLCISYFCVFRKLPLTFFLSCFANLSYVYRIDTTTLENCQRLISRIVKSLSISISG